MATTADPPRRASALTAASPATTMLAFAWLVASMFAVMLLAAAAIGMYEAVLIAELIALGVLAVTMLAWRRRTAPDAAERRLERRHRERRGF